MALWCHLLHVHWKSSSLNFQSLVTCIKKKSDEGGHGVFQNLDSALQLRKYFPKSLAFVRGMLVVPAQERADSHSLWAGNCLQIETLQSATYILWFPLHPLAGKGVGNGPLESGVQIPRCHLQGPDEPGFSFSGPVHVYWRQGTWQYATQVINKFFINHLSCLWRHITCLVICDAAALGHQIIVTKPHLWATSSAGPSGEHRTRNAV